MDDAGSCVRALADVIPARGLAQVQHVSVDNPSSKLFQEFRLICPNLQIMTLNPVHLAMTWEYASSRKRTAGSKTLRKILSKFTATDDSFDVRRWGRPYDGTTCAPLTYEEARVQRQIQDCSMREKTAQRLLRELDPNKPFYLRIEWIKSLAAVASIYREEVQRVCPGPIRKIRELLFTAACAPRSEWYMNNIRSRHVISSGRLPLPPVGTTSNESLHHEINVWFRETQKLHQSTLALKLHILHLNKNLSHNAALYRPTCRQVPHAELVARVSTKPVWTDAAWVDWYSELCDDRRMSQAALPLHTRRESERQLVRRTSTRKRPATAKAAGIQRRRTPHTLQRRDSLRRAGVKGRMPG